MFLSAACHPNEVYGLKVLERERLPFTGSPERPGGERQAGVVRRPQNSVKILLFQCCVHGAQTLLAILD